jgi:tetratricopeptide (TPR) repeat protein
MAAVFGRQLDLALLQAVSRTHSLDRWLVSCAETAVLDIQEGVWCFAHDKLRDGLLADLPPEERQFLHWQAATALETVYRHPQEHLASLVYHWRMAGNHPKELHYTLLMEEELLTNGAYTEAIKLAEQAQSLQPTPDQTALLHLQIGRACYGLGQFDNSQHHLLTSLSRYQALNDKSQIAQCLYHLGLTTLSLGAYHESHNFGHRSLELARQAADKLGIARALNAVGMTLYRLGDYQESKQAHEEALAIAQAIDAPWEAAKSLNNLGNVAYEWGHYPEAESLYLQSKTVCQAIGHQQGVARALNNLALIAERHHNYDGAYHYHEESLAIKRLMNDRPAISISLLNMGVNCYARERYEEATRLMQESMSISEEIGDTWGMACCLSNLGDVAQKQQLFTQARENYWAAWYLTLSIQAMPLAMAVLTSMAELLTAEQKLAPSLQLVGFILPNPGTDEYERERCQKLLIQLENVFSEIEVTTALENGAQLTLNQIDITAF